MASRPIIDPTDMKGNQKGILGVDSFDVGKDYQNTVNSVNTDMPDAVDSSVNRSFVDAAPNLPFKLPFGLDKIFSSKNKKDST